LSGRSPGPPGTCLAGAIGCIWPRNSAPSSSGGYALLLLWGIRALAAGPEAYQAFLTSLGSPLSLGLHWLVLAVTLFHTISWFGVTPKAMPVQIGEAFLPSSIIVGGHYVLWIALSLFILFIAGVFNGG
jgi:fumarate reductase subunit C